MSNNKGFTLIELLAVITIMGILMMVAIPTVSRTIENSRKDTFIDTAKKYADSAQTMWMGDNLLCMASDGNRYSSSAMPVGTYYIEIDTTSETVPVLLEQGGKSSWGSRDIKGYVKVEFSEQVGLYGDANMDNQLKIFDSVFTLQVVNGTRTVTEFQKKLIDLNFDGKITEDDTLLILRLIDGYDLEGVPMYYRESKIDFYPVISDDVHGINLNDGANSVKSEDLVRGDMVMSNATYDKVSLPASALMCIER